MVTSSSGSQSVHHATTLLRDCAADNDLMQRTRGNLSQIHTLREAYDQQPEIFNANPHNLPGPDQ